MVNLAEVRKHSMLDVPVLERLQTLARQGSGGILEVGPYIGGSTIALTSGHLGKRRHAVIEAGGAYPSHPHSPTDDIVADWNRNMERYGQTGRAQLFEGWSNVPSVLNPAMEFAGPIGLFFFDANGEVAAQFDLCGSKMVPGCTIVLDDYIITDAGKHKADLVAPWIRKMVDRGALIEDEIIDGTWFGRLGKVDSHTFRHFSPETGHAWCAHAPSPSLGKLAVFEDGRLLGPGEAMHVDIRQKGGGAFSHWMFGERPLVLFSTSDNSDPNTNGRKYEFR